MAQLTWVFNAASGSDTQASGAGPGNGIVSGSALFGTNASFSGSVVTLDGSPDLSAFAAGTWGLWLQTSTGRQFFDLSSANDGADTVTCVTAPAGTASGLTWAIGGKRQTLDGTNSRLLFTADIKTPWAFYFEDDQTITSEIVVYNSHGANAGAHFYGPSGRATITQTANAAHFTIGATSGSSYHYLFENLKFVNSNGTKTSAVALNSSGTIHFRALRCIFGDSTNKLLTGMKIDATFSASSQGIAEDCFFDSCTGPGFQITGGNSAQAGEVYGCTFKSCNNASTGNGSIQIAGNNRLIVQDCKIYGGNKSGIYIATAQNIQVIKNNTIHSNTGASSDGVTINAIGNTGYSSVTIVNNNITANGRYGISVPATNYYHYGTLMPQMLIDYNNFGTGATANTSGARSNLTAGAHDLAVDPGYTDAANGDFSVGTAVKALAFPSAFPDSIMTSYVDVGAAQRQETSSSTLPITKSKYNEGFN